MFCDAVSLVPNTTSSERIQPVVLPHVPNHVISKRSKFSIYTIQMTNDIYVSYASDFLYNSVFLCSNIIQI